MMDANRRKALQMTVSRTMRALEQNNMKAAYVETREDALKLVRSLIPEGSTTSSGGSVTLAECGIMDYLKEKTDYIDRNMPGIDEDEARRLVARMYVSDWFLSSANAITQHGEIYQVDGRSNRISCLVFGPRKVIIVAGVNKIVPDLRAAVERVKHTAAPANCIRLSCDTFCAKSGVCISPSFDESDLMCHADCGQGTICCNTLIMKRQREKDRVTVILVGEDLGY